MDFFPQKQTSYVRHQKAMVKDSTLPFLLNMLLYLKKNALKVQANLENEIELSETIAVFAAKALVTIWTTSF